MGEGEVNKKIMFEALESLIEKREEEIKILSIDNDFYFNLWTDLIDFIHAQHGLDGLAKATVNLSKQDKERVMAYIRDNFDNVV